MSRVPIPSVLQGANFIAPPGGMTYLFSAHASFCVRNSWEVVFALVALTISLIPGNLPITSLPPLKDGDEAILLRSSGVYTSKDYQGLDAIFMSIIRCAAILYAYQQWMNLKRLNGKYVLILVALCAAMSSFLFSSLVLNLLKPYYRLEDFRDSFFLFMLFMDLSKAVVFTQYVLMAPSRREICRSIENGLAILGPSVALDTMVEILVIGVGSLCGIKRLEMVCNVVCLGVFIRFLIFATFLPASLSLLTDLHEFKAEIPSSPEQLKQIQKLFGADHEESPSIFSSAHRLNPIIRRMKIIMSIGLAVIHVVCRSVRWSRDVDTAPLPSGVPSSGAGTDGNGSPTTEFLLLLSSHAQSLVLLVIICSLMYKHLIERADVEELVRSNGLAGRIERSTSPFRQTKFTLGGESDESGAEGKCNESNLAMKCSRKSRRRVRYRADSETTVVAPSSSEEESEGENEVTEEDENSRSIEESLALLSEPGGAKLLTDQEILNLMKAKKLPPYKLETALDDGARGVRIRRKWLLATAYHVSGIKALKSMPFRNFDYRIIVNACAENVVGHVSLPLGVAGPIAIDGKDFLLPMATTEGCLIASVNRGCAALSLEGGITARILKDGMSRGPVFRLPSLAVATEFLRWAENPESFARMKEAFDATSRFARLQSTKVCQSGRLVFIRFIAQTGDAMGMNMISKGVEATYKTVIIPEFSDKGIEVVSISGNYCCDKKSAAINWIEGRGKSVVAEGTVSRTTLQTLLKTTPESMVDINTSKNFVGSAMAGALGGFNAHAANLVAAVFIACGQDPAQVIESSQCLTFIEMLEGGRGVRISVTMPAIECGTVGGGTFLQGQKTSLELLGIRGPNFDNPGTNAKQLAKVVAATVLAGELNVLAALAGNDVVKAHISMNRSTPNILAGATAN